MALEERYAEARLSVQRVQRGDRFLNLDPDMILERGDRLVVSARRKAFPNAEQDIGPEVDDLGLLSVPLKTAAIVVTNRNVIGKRLDELGQDPMARGVYLDSLQRGPELMPREPWVVVGRGAVLSMGVFLGASTRIYDRETREVSFGKVPPGAVVVPGSLPAADGSHSLYCAVIVKKVDAQTRAKTSINELLRR